MEKEKSVIIRKVWQKANGQLHITIPKNQDIVKGDYVKVLKIQEATK